MMYEEMIALQNVNRIYTTGHVLGRGGFSAVYAEYRNPDQLLVAIKMVETRVTPMVKIYHNNNNISNSEEDGSFTKIALELHLI